MAEKAFWHDIEGAPWREVVRVQEEKLQRQMDYLWARSPFYQRKLSQAGIKPNQVRTLQELQQVPLTVKQELRESIRECPPLGLHLAAPRREVIQVQASSGTTGSPSYVGITRHDLEVWCEMGARVFYANGFRPGDFCLHAFSMSRGFVGGVPILQILQYMGVCDLPIGVDAGTERLLRVLADQRPEALGATPYYAIYLGEQAEALLGVKARDLSVRKISVGGEPGGGIPAVRAKMEELWNADVREMMGGTDLGCTYWAECEDKSGMHFCAQEFIIPEIIDPQSQQVLEPKEGTKGELVYTAIDRQASPLLRFRTGDHVVVTGTDCRCGRTGYKIRCFGRTDDMLIVKGVNVFPSAIKDVVTSFEPRTTGLMKVIVDFPGHTTQHPLKLKVEYGPGVALQEVPQLREELSKKLQSLLAFRPEIEMVPPDSLEKPGVQKVSLIERVVGA
jgi:phenylacetate-CoA ligase